MTSLPESYKALTYAAPSTPPHLTHQPLTPPGPNELLIKIKAAAINPVDIQLWGNPVIGLLAGKREKGIGRDYSGIIVAVGKELNRKWVVGDEVFGLFSRPVCGQLSVCMILGGNGEDGNTGNTGKWLGEYVANDGIHRRVRGRLPSI